MSQLTEDTFDQIFNELYSDIDLKDVSFIDPFGMLVLLEIGELHKSKGIFKNLLLPQSEEVLKYLDRMDFFKFAVQYFNLEPSEPKISGKYRRNPHSDVLLEITSIEKTDDIHDIVKKVKNRGHAILKRNLNYSDKAVNGFIVALSEVCQNILEHSQNTGFVGIQKYHFNNLNKNVVKIAVMDIGIGFRKSLSERFSLKNDLDAVEKALLHGASRYKEEGRGHGLAAVRRFVNQWDGRISIRSGRAKLSIIPAWSHGKKREQNLPCFPGAQINILLPEI